MRRPLLVLTCALALTAATATPVAAHTRPTKAGVWDRLAACESGGRWNLPGRRYSGGLQFDLHTWRAVGGRGFPHEATREEQIRRATILHARRGFRPWPGCARRLGLR